MKKKQKVLRLWYSSDEEVKNFILHIMDMDKALFIYLLRELEGFTWRSVARKCHREFPLWDFPSHQTVGKFLCYYSYIFLDSETEGLPY